MNHSVHPCGCRCRAVALACGVVMTLAGTGCISTLPRWIPDGWVADYDTAEQRFRDSGRELLIFYKDTRPGVDDSMEQILGTDPVEGLTRSYVRCRLFKPYEPDRRYVAQFGVERAPAMIVVHRDGTYHAQTGPMSSAQIVRFLADARRPGAPAALNPHIPREARYDWRRTIDKAEEDAERTGRPMLIVFHRTLSRDWQTLKKMLSRREVYSRVADMVHCRVGTISPWANAYITRFGALRLPSIVIARRDGTHNVLELPTSYEAIVRFADAARHAQRAAGRKASASRPTTVESAP